MIYGTTANTGAGEGQGLTLAHLLEAKRRLDAALGPAPPAVKIIQDANALTRAQAKVYPKRKAKNEAHRRRMNHKWLRRYGYTYTPAMYQMDLAATGLGSGKVVIVHPALMPRLRSALNGTLNQEKS
jgi:hypothetical protein